MPYISKVDTAQKIYAEELRKIGASADKWKDFLDFSAKSNLSDNQGMSEFSSKVVIHAYNPNAVDCRTYDDWKQQEGNHVARGQHGIPVLTRDSSGKVRVAHVFDTSQTAQKRLPEKPELSESAKERLAVSLRAEIRKFANNPRFGDEQKRLFTQTAEYKLSKQYGLKINEDTERFSGIEKLSVNEKAFIGIALNGCSRSFAQIVNNERSISNEREYDNKPRDDRQGLRGREQRGMDLDSGRTANAHEKIRLPSGNGNVGQTEHGTGDIRADVLGSRTEAHSSNGQVRQHETEIYMADTAPDGSHNAERGIGNRYGEAEPSLRGNERKSSEPDRRDSGEEEAVSGIQEIGGNREISSESADVGAVQNGSGGRDTSRDGVRNITDETAEPEKGSAVSDLSDNENPHEYPYVTVKGGRNYDLLIAPELEEKEYSVAEFNSALGKLNERWDDEEYEGKTAFVDLTVHLSETETFEKRLYAEYQFDSLSERLEFDDDIFDKEVKLRQAVREAENKAEDKQEAPEYTGIEKAFLNSDTAAFMAKAVLSWDEIESIGYRLYEKGYNDRYSPSEKAIFGNGMREQELYETAKKMQRGEDIRKELSSALLGSQTNFRTERGNEFAVQYGDEYITARYGNAEKQISYEDMGNAFLKLIEDEHKDIVHGRTVEDLQYVIPDLNSETAEKLITAFDSTARPEWENNFQKQQNIKRTLNDILGDEGLTVKAFNSIADMKYNYKPEPVKADSLEFHFGSGEDDDWVSESDIVHDFALANPDCSFALGNAVLEYLDEKQHTERNIEELHAGWYKKTDFDITATINGEDFHYSGRFDIGDGKGTGGGSLLEHIRDFNQSIMDTDKFPYNTPKAKEQAKNTLEILVPFLEKNAILNEREQEILGKFKLANPIRSREDIEKKSTVEVPEVSADEIITDMPDNAVEENTKPTVADLAVGDVILYEGSRREIEEISEKSISMKDLDAPDFGGILLGTNEVLAYDGWQNDMNEKGFEIISKAEPEITLNVGKEVNKDISENNHSSDRDKFIDKLVTSAVEHFKNEPALKAIYEDKDGSFVMKNSSLAAASQAEKLNVAFSLKFDNYVMNALRGEIPEFQRDEDMTALRSVFDDFREDRGLVDSVHSAFTEKLIQAFEEPQTEKSADKNEINNSDSFNENAVKYAFSKITEEHNYDFTNPTFMYLGHLQNYMIDHKINDIVVGATSDTMRNYYGNAPLTNEYFSPDYTFSKDLPEEYNKYFQEYIGMEKSADMNKTEELDGQTAQNGKKEIPDKITFEVFGGGSLTFRDKEMNDLAKISADGIKFYTELSENDRKKVTDKAKEMQAMAEKNVQKPEFEADPVGEQLELFHVEKERPYRIITYDRDSSDDDKEDFPTLKEALNRADDYLKNGYDGYAIYNKDTQTIEDTWGYFPSEKVFSVEVLLKNGVITPEQEPDMIKGLKEDIVRDKVVSELLKSEDLKKSAENNSREDFAVPYYEAVNNALTDMLDNSNIYATKKEISYLLDDEEYLHNVFGDYDKVYQQLAPEKESTKKEISQNNEDWQTARPRQNFHEIPDGNLKITDPIQEAENSVRNNLLGALQENYDNIPMDNLIKDLQENNISVLNAIEVMRKSGFEFGDSITYQNPENATADRVTVTHSELTSDNVPEAEEPTADIPEQPKKKPDYFRITDEHLGEAGKREKFQNNIEAIKTLKQLEEEERPATPEEQKTLSKYVGWGGLQEAFDVNEPSWNKEYYELKNMLSEGEYEAARATVNDAFYTSPVITNAIYEGLSNIGFKGGEVLEPSCGVGNFFGTMPDSMRENSNLSGVEIDSISGRIAQKLYPEASIAINGFEKVKPSKGAFDVAIGNVPFGNHGVADNTKAYKGLLIHDYFFAKSIDSVRSGGVVAFVTSTGTLDKEDTKVRQMLAQKAELMGAVRLPNNAFQKNAGTPTTTDIIFLKKREKPLNISEMAADKSCDWVHTKENADGYKINSYFTDNPNMIMGELSDKGRFGSIICTPIHGADLKEQLHDAMKNIKGEYAPLEFQSELDERAENNYLPATPDVENLTYTVVEDKLYFRMDDNLIPLKESEQHGAIANRRKAMCGLGETTRELLKAQVEDRPDSEIKSLQNELNRKYDSFVKKFGRINPIEAPSKSNSSGVSRKSANSNAFKNDVRLPLLQSLEKMKEGQFIGKTEIFTERTIRPRQVAEHVETAQEALILSMSEKGKIDLDYMKQLTGFEENKLIGDLHGDIFPVPELSSESKTVYQTADEYLSGNIYKKIAAAEEKIAENPQYAENIAALTEVIPTPLKATEIDMQLGMTWIDPKVIQQFMYEKFETPYPFQEYQKDNTSKNPNAITVSYSGAGKGSWKIENAQLDNSVKSTKTLGTKDYNAYELLEKILNSKSVAVTDTYRDNEGKTKTVIREEETRAAEDKVKLINEEFKKWIFANPERRNELVKTYNEKFNCIRPREYDGSNLNFFGSNPEITLKPHQKNAVAHALFGGNTLFAHEVGAGKTFEMIATAMEGKRLGLHTKSMFVVPNHLTEQIGSDFMKLYPNANILVAKPDDFSPQKRRQMCARIATGNFDAVIIGHSQLIKIPLSPKREEEFIKNQINDVVASLEAAKETDSKSYTVKQLEATKKNLRDRLEKLTNSTVKDNAVTFEELGVDKLFVDEAHEFKNLYVSTKMENVSGLSTNADVQKTQDLYMKCQYLDEKTGGKGIVFSTGTPVSNSMTELYTMMRYLQTELLRDCGINHFD